MLPKLFRNQQAGLCCLVTWLALVATSAVGSERPNLSLEQRVLAHHTRLVAALYQDSLAGAQRLGAAIDQFIDQPSQESLGLARQAWLEARVPYLQTEVCRFYDGPIDAIEGLINAWPIDENYIDYVADSPNAGIINAVEQFPNLTRDLIRSLNEKEGQKNISAGYHAIEFLLWGQDQNTKGPGDRSWRDYAAGAKNYRRRQLYLRLCAEELVADLASLVRAWNEESDYRKDFLLVAPEVALGRILKGMGVLSGPELSGERLTVAYETKEQEDEHSCFSDNTCNDLLYDVIGIQNVFFGRYQPRQGARLEGPGVYDLLKSVDPDLAEKLAAQINASVTAVRAIPAPFDQAILGASGSPGRVAVKAAATTLQAQSDLIARAAKALDCTF